MSGDRLFLIAPGFRDVARPGRFIDEPDQILRYLAERYGFPHIH